MFALNLECDDDPIMRDQRYKIVTAKAKFSITLIVHWHLGTLTRLVGGTLGYGVVLCYRRG